MDSIDVNNERKTITTFSTALNENLKETYIEQPLKSFFPDTNALINQLKNLNDDFEIWWIIDTYINNSVDFGFLVNEFAVTNFINTWEELNKINNLIIAIADRSFYVFKPWIVLDRMLTWQTRFYNLKLRYWFPQLNFNGQHSICLPSTSLSQNKDVKVYSKNTPIDSSKTKNPFKKSTCPKIEYNYKKQNLYQAFSTDNPNYGLYFQQPLFQQNINDNMVDQNEGKIDSDHENEKIDETEPPSDQNYQNDVNGLKDSRWIIKKEVKLSGPCLPFINIVEFTNVLARHSKFADNLPIEYIQYGYLKKLS
jgi:hypothetical protein